MMPSRITALSAILVFPAGLAPGAGRERSHALLARDGRDRPVLRGTALAGVLRHACVSGGFADVDAYFGLAQGSAGVRSRLLVPDIVLDCGDGGVTERNHIRKNRHSGAVADQALFSVEACPPGTRAPLVLWLESGPDHSREDDEAFLERIVTLLRSGAVAGGSGSRGLGRWELDGDVRKRVFDLEGLDGYADYLEAHLQWRTDGTAPGGDICVADARTGYLDVSLELTIPRGQDLLIADGRGGEYDLEPQEIEAADGGRYWRLPGATMRGLLRDWMTRLAARDGVEGVFDAGMDKQEGDLSCPSGHEFGQAGAQSGAEVSCPIADLFGTTHRRGRIHVSDALAPVRDGQRQVRMHVSVDAVTGGARDAALFDNTVVVSPPEAPVIFDLKIRIDTPREQEVSWLARSIRALDLGLLRVGSSKAVGALCLASTPKAEGSPLGESLTGLEPSRRERS